MHGFQKQPGFPTVQGRLEEALGRIAGARTRVMGAGRTDSGVHAVGQVVAFDLDPGREVEKVIAGMNALLSPDISVPAASRARDGFDPRRDALWREYRYFFWTGAAPSPFLEEFTHRAASGLDVERMSRACELAVGSHDFSAFRVKAVPGEAATRDVLECGLHEPCPGVLCVRVRANAFLYRMVRILAGALHDVGRGRMDTEELAGHLEGGDRPCAEALPARGLFLWRVEYPAGITIDGGNVERRVPRL